MSSSAASKSKSCADCYFRQELVCALKTEVPCPTFRPVQEPVPTQARLVELPSAMLTEAAPAAAAEVTRRRVAASARPAPVASVSVEPTGTMPLEIEGASAPRVDRIAERVAQRFPNLVRTQ